MVMDLWWWICGGLVVVDLVCVSFAITGGYFEELEGMCLFSFILSVSSLTRPD